MVVCLHFVFLRGAAIFTKAPSERGLRKAVEEIAQRAVQISLSPSYQIFLCTHSPSVACATAPSRKEPFVSLSRARKSADGCVAVCLFTPYSSVSLHSASSVCLPPSLTREGSCKSRFWATDGCAAVTDTTLDRRRLVAQQVAGTHGPYRF